VATPQDRLESTPGDPQAAPATLIAAAVDPYPEGRDAAALGSMLAGATGGELLLVAIHPEPLVVLPRELSWSTVRKQAEASLRQIRGELAPSARIVVETDWSVPRALERVIAREHRNLLVMGSSRHGPEGQVRIGKRTRQLLCHFRCALAVAPRGLSARASRTPTRVGVGYDGSPESEVALAVAGSIAVAAGARLSILGVVDVRIPGLSWSRLGEDQMKEVWSELLEPQVDSLRVKAQVAAEAIGGEVGVDIRRGRPADALRELGDQVDLLVIGSRRWGTAARVLLGSTGEALLHSATCPVLVVPRPRNSIFL
jgi:nucleotide-binding universal stress UspA family protein